ncbi:MAG: hypothetical protein LBV51_02035 [Acholeplasmatales bacterium]|jgi:hypothetical protein|nr:hypothetical protein [Acholeplasmatales bacterium]
MKKLFLLLLSVILVTLVSCAKDDLETESSILWFTENSGSLPYEGVSWNVRLGVDSDWDLDMSNIPIKLLFSQDGIYDADGNWIADKGTFADVHRDDMDLSKDLYEGRIFGYQIIDELNTVLYSGVISKFWETFELLEEESSEKYLTLNVSFPEFVPIFNVSENRYIIPAVHLCLVVVDTISDLEVSKFPIVEFKDMSGQSMGYWMSIIGYRDHVFGDYVLRKLNFSELFYYRYFLKYGIQVTQNPAYYYYLENQKTIYYF